MRTRKLGYSDLEITAVGLGAWAIGGSWSFGWGKQEDSDSIAAIHEAMDSGINWIDTAAIYGQGRSERIVGAAIKGMSRKPLVATKCGLIWNDTVDRIECLEPASVVLECENSLKRLGVEVIDLYQIHRPGNDEETLAAWGVVADLIKQGKVRYGGVSNFSVELMEKCQAIHPIASSQPQYNMLIRDVEDGELEYCSENNIGVIVYSPMGRGLLTGKFDSVRLANLAEDDHRRRNPLFQEPKFGRVLDLIEHLKPIAERNSITLAQLSVAWVLRRSEVTAAIVGARRAGQIGETAGGGDVELSQDDIMEIDELLKTV